MFTRHLEIDLNERIHSKFLDDTHHVSLSIEERMRAYSDVLYGVRSFVQHEDDLTQQEWADFVGSQELSRRLPGIRAMRFVEKVVGKEDQKEHFFVKHVFPLSGNELMLGLDLARDETRLQNVRAAITSNQPTLSKSLSLVTDPEKKKAILITLSVLRHKEVIGLVQMACRIEDILADLLDEEPLFTKLRYQIWTASDEGEKSPLYECKLHQKDARKEIHYLFVKKYDLAMGGQIWSLRFDGDLPPDLPLTERFFPAIVLGTGTLLGFLLALLFYFLLSTRWRAQEMARDASQFLAKSKEELSLALDSAGMGVWSWNPHSNKVIWDEQTHALFGVRVGEFGGELEDFLKRIGKQDRPLIEEAIKQALSKRGNYRVEFQAVWPDSSLHDMDVRGQVFQNSAGEPERMIGVIWDITEQKKLKAQMIQSQKMELVGLLSGGIAHDLNNQLTPVIGFLDLLLRQCTKEDSSHALLQGANLAAKECVAVVRSLLAVCRSSTQQNTLISVGNLLENIQKNLVRFIPPIISVQVVQEADCNIEGNQTELQSVLMNLIINARDAMPHGGLIKIAVKRVELCFLLHQTSQVQPYLSISVKDNGKGMPRTVMERIFDPFFTTKKMGKGTGLGLTMAYNIVKNHGGWIDVSSKEGRGSQFEIFLPEAAAGEFSPLPAQEETVESLKGNGELILVAEDGEALRNLAKLFLESLGYQVLLAADGFEALQIYRERKENIQAAFVDMTMPCLLGREVLKRILEINPSAKVILTSGFTAEGSPETFLQEGAAAFLEKPYTILTLGATLKKVLSSQTPETHKIPSKAA